MTEAPGIRQRVAARDALAARARRLTTAALTVSAALSGVFAGMAAASAPGRQLHSGPTAQPASAAKQPQSAKSARASTAIPPLPPPPGPGNLSAGPPPAPSAAPAPAPAQTPPVVVSGGS